MKPGQVLTKWWQDYVAGAFKAPASLYRAARFEKPDGALASDRFFDIPPDDTFWNTPARLSVQAPFFTADRYLQQSGKADWAFCDRRLMRWAAVFVELARKRSIPLYVHCALRSEAEQRRLFSLGHSKAVYPRSAHNIGEAVDIVHSVFHWELTQQEWAFLHLLGLRALDLVNASLSVKPRLDRFGKPLPYSSKLSLNWGGDEGPSDAFRWDSAHWEITDFRHRIRILPVSDPVPMTPRYILKNITL